MKSFTLVNFLLQPAALLPKHLQIIPPCSPSQDKWSAYDSSRGNPLSRSNVQSDDRSAREGRGEGRELDGEGQQSANLTVNFSSTSLISWSLLGQFFSSARFSL